MRATTAAVGLMLILASPATAQRVPPTDIRAVEALIDAPHALFGRSRTSVIAALGAPGSERSREMAAEAGGRPDTLDELAYPGVIVGLARGSAVLRRVEISTPRFALPGGVNVGSTRVAVEAALGEAQRATDASAFYTYADGFPYTVELHFRDGRVHRIEWRYAADE